MADYKKVQIVDSSGNILEEVNVKDETARNDLRKKVVYYTGSQINPGVSTEILRIPTSGSDDRITEDTVVLDFRPYNPNRLDKDIDWESHDGYITFSGTCFYVTWADIVLGTISN